MRLCIDCAWYGGVQAATGKYFCNEPRAVFIHPVDGLPAKYDASWLRMAPELQSKCGWEGKWFRAKGIDNEARRVPGESMTTPEGRHWGKRMGR